MAGGESAASPGCSEAPLGRDAGSGLSLLISGDGLGRVVLDGQRPGQELTHQLT